MNMQTLVTSVATGEEIKIWPFVAVGAAVLVIVLLFVVPAILKKKENKDQDNDET